LLLSKPQKPRQKILWELSTFSIYEPIFDGPWGSFWYLNPLNINSRKRGKKKRRRKLSSRKFHRTVRNLLLQASVGVAIFQKLKYC